LRLKPQWLAAHWKLLTVPAAAVVAGLAIAVPASMASTHRTADPGAAPRDGAGHDAAHAAASPPVLRPTPSRTGCHVTYTPTTWPGQLKAKVTIRNTGRTRISDWTLAFTFPGDETISSAWNARFTQVHTSVSATSTDYNTVIPRGGSQSFGFLGSWNSNDTAPSKFSVNGTACS
jgi:endo-1,4-beta-xylanase